MGVFLTGCVRAVCPASEVVLQQLVSPRGTGSSHQPHCGLMKKHLQEKVKHIRARISVFLGDGGAGKLWTLTSFHCIFTTRHIYTGNTLPSVEPFMQSTEWTFFRCLTASRTMIMIKLMWFLGVSHKWKHNKWSPTAVKAAVVQDPQATVMTTPINLISMTDDMLNCGGISAAGESGRELDF